MFGKKRDRREVLKLLAMAAVAPSMPTPGSVKPSPLSLELPPLPYPYDALEPHIDAETMRLHHDKHHAAYLANVQKAVEQAPQLAQHSLEELLSKPELVPEGLRMVVRNHGGGHYNHSLFWQCLSPAAPVEPEGPFAQALAHQFGSLTQFREQFTKAALGLFGSGWVWLVWADGQLAVTTSPNQDTPLAKGHVPLLGLDVWEHAYYLKYQWRRAEYVAAFWQVTNWPFVAQRWQEASGSPPPRQR